LEDGGRQGQVRSIPNRESGTELTLKFMVADPIPSWFSLIRSLFLRCLILISAICNHQNRPLPLVG
jgi:hypothetical protein